MSNANGTRTIQASSSLVKELSLLAIKRDTTRRNLVDQAIREFIEKMKNNEE